MAYQKTEEALNDYFDALLQGDGLAPEHPEGEKNALDNEELVTKVQPTPEQVTKETPKDSDSHTLSKTLNDDPSSTPVSAEAISPKQAEINPAPVNENKTPYDALNTREKASFSLSDADNAQSNSVAMQEDKEEKAISTENSTSDRAAREVKAGEIAPSAPRALSATPSATTQYQEHKLRLEKMLLQVSELNTTVDHKVTPESQVKEHISPAITPESDESLVDALEESQAFTPLPVISSEWLENGRPNWAQERFDILLVEVNGLQLAVPLIALGQIQPMDDNLTPLFGQSDWFMGLQESPTGRIKTVNTAKFVMPERYQDDQSYRYVVSINGLQWGLAVDSIRQPISIDPDDIRWRAKRSSRPWMAGMVKDHMCVLLDIPAMGDILQNQDKNHRHSTGG